MDGIGITLDITSPITGVIDRSLTPIVVPSDLAGNRLFYKTDDLSTITMDGAYKVSQLNDKSPTNSHATQTTASVQPVYDPIKKVIGAPAAEGKLVIPNMGGMSKWMALTAMIDFSQRAQSSGTIVAINGFGGGGTARSPIVEYSSAGNILQVHWRSADGGQSTLVFYEGVDFISGQYFALLTWFDVSDGSFKAMINNGAVKSVGSGLSPINVNQVGTFGDFRAGWTRFGIRIVGNGIDDLNASHISGLMAYLMQQAAEVNAL